MSVDSAKILSITLPTGESATLVKSDGDKTTILSPLPAPPGATVRGRIDGCSVEFQLKVRNCVRKGELFEIDGRTRNPSREVRTLLIEHSN
jgi:hypothetical protein